MAAEHTHQTQHAILRPRIDGQHSRVSTFELFFDLVFVFAVTQMSHAFAVHLNFEGAIETLVLLLAVWWAWMYTTWATNWLDPDHISVRLMLTVVMLAGLVMSAAIPAAFDGRAFAFAGPYVAIQVGRTLFLLWAMRFDDVRRYTFTRMASWFVLSGVFWLWGAAVDGDARLAMWAVAVAIDYLGPAARFWCPGLGCSAVQDWNIEGGHLAERCGLFIIIALGESLLVTGATFAGLEWSRAVVTSVLASFAAAVAMWWIYFDVTAERSAELIAHDANPGFLGRLAYTYLHLPMVAGLILTAVGDETVLAHPSGDTQGRVALVILGGPALFLAGHWLFKRAVFGVWVGPHVFGVVGLGATLAAYRIVEPAALSVAATGWLIAVGAWLWVLHQEDRRAARMAA